MSQNESVVPGLQKGKPGAVRLLRLTSRLLPGDYLKTAFYLNLIAKPRRFLQHAIYGFYRIDHIYEVLRQAKRLYKGSFSILEFGTADGYAFVKMLYATKYLSMSERVIVHAFDTFEGMPAPEGAGDQDLIVGDSWAEGQFSAGYEELYEYCARRYTNFAIHKGRFEDTLTDEFLEGLTTSLPILIWIDCDFYTSTRSVFERLSPYIASGCVIYFDDYEVLNYGSRFTGEARFVDEANRGLFGDDIELVLDRRLSLDSSRCYRFVSRNPKVRYESLSKGRSGDAVRRRGGGSALP